MCVRRVVKARVYYYGTIGDFTTMIRTKNIMCFSAVLKYTNFGASSLAGTPEILQCTLRHKKVTEPALARSSYLESFDLSAEQTEELPCPYSWYNQFDRIADI